MLAEHAVELVGLDPGAPLERLVVVVGPEGLAELGPALAELAAGGDQGLAGAARGWRPRTPWPPEPEEAKHEHLVRRSGRRVLSPLETARVELDERRRAVVEDGLGHHLETGGGSGVGPAVIM